MEWAERRWPVRPDPSRRRRLERGVDGEEGKGRGKQTSNSSALPIQGSIALEFSRSIFTVSGPAASGINDEGGWIRYDDMVRPLFYRSQWPKLLTFNLSRFS